MKQKCVDVTNNHNKKDTDDFFGLDPCLSVNKHKNPEKTSSSPPPSNPARNNNMFKVVDRV